MEMVDYNWLVDAAGTDEERLADLSLLFAGAAAMLTLSVTPDTKAEMMEAVLEGKANDSVRTGLDGLSDTRVGRCPTYDRAHSVVSGARL